MNIESSVQNKEIHSAKFQSLKEMSSSVPDITSKSQTSSPLLKDIPSFKVSFLKFLLFSLREYLKHFGYKPNVILITLFLKTYV